MNGTTNSTTDGSLALRHPTDAEKTEIWSRNFENWGKTLGLSNYLEREKYLSTIPMNCDGGLTHWILVDPNLPEDNRPILASCESIKKRALVRQNGEVQEVITHGIGSVFCYPEFRKRGYPGIMLNQVGERLRTWQSDGKRSCLFSILYSDIGKVFYAKHGWHPYPSKHLTFAPLKSEASSDSVEIIRPYSDLLRRLCEYDERSVVSELSKSSSTAVSLIPDYETMQWHHLREDFLAKKFCSRTPDIRGAIYVGETHAAQSPGSRVWAIWTRSLYNPIDDPHSENIFHILRLVIENERQEATVSNIVALKSILKLAQSEAAEWNCKHVELWNPSPYVQDLIDQTKIDHNTVDRDTESIPSLFWYGVEGKDTNADDIEWLHNEKFGWC